MSEINHNQRKDKRIDRTIENSLFVPNTFSSTAFIFSSSQNAELRRQHRDEALKRASVSDLQEEIDKITRNERSGIVDKHAADRKVRLLKEIEEAKIREKKAAEKKAEPQPVVNIKGLNKIFKHAQAGGDDRKGSGDDEDDDDDSDEESTDPYQERLKRREAGSGAYTYDDKYRSNLPLALLPGAGSKETIKKIKRGEILDPVLAAKLKASGEGDTNDDDKDEEELPPPPAEPPGLNKPPPDYTIPDYPFGNGLEEEPTIIAPAVAPAPPPPPMPVAPMEMPYYPPQPFPPHPHSHPHPAPYPSSSHYQPRHTPSSSRHNTDRPFHRDAPPPPPRRGAHQEKFELDPMVGQLRKITPLQRSWIVTNFWSRD